MLSGQLFDSFRFGLAEGGGGLAFARYNAAYDDSNRNISAKRRHVKRVHTIIAIATLQQSEDMSEE